MKHISEADIVERLKRESHCIFVQPLKCLYKCSKALAAIHLVSAEDAVKAFPAVIRNPCKLSAVVVQESGSKADAFAGRDIHKSRVVIGTVKIFNLTGGDELLLDTT